MDRLCGKTRLLLLTFGIAVAIVISGCQSHGQVSVIDKQARSQIKIGETTKEQVLSLMGEPAQRHRQGKTIDSSRGERFEIPPSESWHYSYTYRTDAGQYFHYLGFLILPLRFADLAMRQTKTESAMYTFDENGKVKNIHESVIEH